MFNPFINSDAVALSDRGVAGAGVLDHDELAAQTSTYVDDRTPITTDRANETLGHYQIEGVISSGGMGTVRRARDLRSGHAVAIKTLRRDLLGQTDVMKRFRREIRIGNLDHRYIMPVIDDGESGEQPYYVMPLARDSLAKLSGLYGIGALATNNYKMSPTGSCGIFVHQASVDVLRVTITPLEPEN